MDICKVFHFWGQGKWPAAITWVELGRILIPSEASQPLANYFPAIFQLLGLSAELETTSHCIQSTPQIAVNFLSMESRVISVLLLARGISPQNPGPEWERRKGIQCCSPGDTWPCSSTGKSPGLHSAKDWEKINAHYLLYEPQIPSISLSNWWVPKKTISLFTLWKTLPQKIMFSHNLQVSGKEEEASADFFNP